MTGPPEGSRWLAHNLSRVGVFCFTPSKCEGRVRAVTVSNSVCLLAVFKLQPSYWILIRSNEMKSIIVSNLSFLIFLIIKILFVSQQWRNTIINGAYMVATATTTTKTSDMKGFLKLKAPFLWPHHDSHCAASLPLVGTTSTRTSSKSKCWQLREKQPTQPSAALH